MVIGLLTLAAIPTVTGLSLAISERSKPQTLRKERARMKKFTMTCWCEGQSRGKSEVHGGHVVLGEGKMWIQSRRTTPQPGRHLYPFNGFYLDYPDDQRPPPPPTGLVTMVSDSPPMMNWIYIDTKTWEVRHGNRTQSRRHWVGNFGWTGEDDDEEEGNDDDDGETDPGGLVLQSEERFLAVEPLEGSEAAADGRWEVFWDRHDDKLANLLPNDGQRDRLVLRVSLERAFIEEVAGDDVEEPRSDGQTPAGTQAQAADDGSADRNQKPTPAQEAYMTQQSVADQIVKNGTKQQQQQQQQQQQSSQKKGKARDGGKG